MKIKKVVTGVVAVFGMAAIVSATSYFTVKATTGDWKTDTVNDSYSRMIDVANTTKNELTKDVNGDITKSIQTNIDKTIEEQEKELERLLNEYYQMKLDGVVNTDEYKRVEGQIKQIKEDLVVTYKKRIDDEFNKK